MIRVDAHHHVWDLARGDYGWLTPDLAIHRDYTLADLRPLLGDIAATVLVQAAPTEAETTFLLDVAARSDNLVRGVVGWADLAAPDAPGRIAALSRNAALKGLRPMLQDITDTAWILHSDVRPALRHLPVMLKLASGHPNLLTVIDHGAKPAIAQGIYQPWADDIACVARDTEAFCKLSGLVTEAASGWRVDDLRRYTDHLVACFGPGRLMWGSDWPVVGLGGGYAAWRAASQELLKGLDEASRDAILGGTACTFYSLDAPK
jgi:L-fuconolactonase